MVPLFLTIPSYFSFGIRTVHRYDKTLPVWQCLTYFSVEVGPVAHHSNVEICAAEFLVACLQRTRH